MDEEKQRVSVIPQDATIGGKKFNLLDLGHCRFDGPGWTKLTHDEWMAQGRARFGENTDLWSFVCPSCGNVQAIGDFRKYKDRGATPESAAMLCIGRFTGATGAFDPAKHKPCNYTANGLLCLCTTVVVFPNGAQQGVFEFAPSGPVPK